MELPIKHCGKCRNAFTLSEFMALPLMHTGRSDNDRETQTRMCHCDYELTVATEYYLDRQAAGALTISHAQYARDFPRSARAPMSIPGAVVISDEEGEAIGYHAPRFGSPMMIFLYVALCVLVAAMLIGASLAWEWFA